MVSRLQKLRQFSAVLRKNFILQTRGRRSILGVSGWGALIVQILLPVAFFSLMCIPTYYIQPYQHPVFLQSQEYDIDTKWWAGASPYEGPAYSTGGNARVVFVPDTPAVQSLVTRVAMAVSCPSEPYKRVCSSSSITTFACLFGVREAPAGCQDSSTCMQTPSCYQPALSSHFRLLSSEDEVLQLLQQKPNSVDAVVVFPQAAAAAAAAAAGQTTSAHTLASKQRSSRARMAQLHADNGDGLLLDYVVRMNSSDVPPTQLLLDMYDVSPGIMPLPGNLLWEYRKYWFFSNLQLVIDRALLGGQQSNGSVPANLGVKIKPFPWPAKQEDLGAAAAAAFFNLLLVYAFMAPTRAVVGSIVREKELRLREGMKILGLSASAYWWSWSLTHWLTLAASGLLCALVGKYPFSHSSLVLMLAFYWLFSAALISFSYFLSTLFSASRVAGTATQFIYALSMIPGFLLPFARPYGGVSWYLASLSPTSAASLFAAALVNWERLAAGVQWNTLLLPVNQGSGYCVGSVMWLLAVDVLLYAVLTWLYPPPMARLFPPWFILQPSYWRSNSVSRSTTGSRTSKAHHRRSRSRIPQLTGHDDPTIPLTSDNYAPADPSSHVHGVTGSAPVAGQPYVRVVGLRRVFHSSDGGSRVAVEGLNLQMCAGRITALLGHNGAGKTTTIHMLTGMLQPTSGTAYIGGRDIITQMSAIRQSLGICPQFDILWPDITVLEHLVMYAVIKGATWANANREAKHAAAEVGLSDKSFSRASELSGGQRRKLSVAIAFLGTPAVVFLDEPTSGMDPYSRRATWEVIRSRRSSSVIVLTTHSMEEADLLCDDVHIMADGRLVASGTPLTLKTQYGVGYTLTVVLQKTFAGLHKGLRHGAGSTGSISSPVQDGMHHSSSSSSLAAAAGPGVQPGPAAAAEALLQLIRSHVSSAVLLSAAGAEVSVRLPKEDSAAFPAVLRSLDGSADSLGITSYGLSVTTLEEVFLAVADQAPSMHRKPQHARNLSSSSNMSSASSRSFTPSATVARQAAAGGPPVGGSGLATGGKGCSSGACGVGTPAAADGGAGVLSGASLYWQQFQALFMKRMLCARRDRLAVITQLLVPLLLVLLAMVVSTLQTSQHQQPQLEMTRQTCLFGAPAMLAAAPAVRQQVEFRGFMDGYPRSDILDTQYTQLYHGSAGLPLNLTLEGQLLSQFYSGPPHYDSMYLQHMPPLEQLLTSLGEAPVMTLLVNQSAVSGLPAALNQATTALLRVMVAAGGGKSHPNLRRKPAQSSSSIRRWSSIGNKSSGHQLPSNTGYSSNSSRVTGGEADVLLGAGPQLSTESVSGTSQRRLHSISIRNFSSTAAACDASSCACVGGGHLPSCLPRIRVSSAPLPLLPGEGAERVREDAGALMLVLCMTMAASVLSASFVVYLVREQENNSKHLQLVSGAPPTAFWLANYCWDIINFTLPAAGIVLLMWGYNQPQLAGSRLAATAVLLWVFGSAGINLTYLCHFMFKDEMKALQRLNTAYFLVGYLGFTTTWVLSLIARVMSKPSLSTATESVKGVLRVISPHYCFAQGLYDITNTYQGQGGLPIPGPQPEGPTNPFAYSVLGVAVVHLLAQALLFGLATVLQDVGVLQLVRLAWCWARDILGGEHRPGRRRVVSAGAAGVTQPGPHGTGLQQQQQQPDQQHLLGCVGNGKSLASAEAVEAGVAVSRGVVSLAGVGEDADVVAERLAVQAGEGLQDAMVVLDGISKSYPQGYPLPPVRAVRGLWLRVIPGECFGLLGVNGAGKTTTFKILTGEVTPDTGDALIAGHSVLTQRSAARRSLGYCPQFEALPSAMTGREVLHMYARLRGVRGRQRVQHMAQQLLDELGLAEYADVVCGTYSGGNKRKLNVAVALVGGPPLVLLDEPSTGMDPAARRFLWRVLQSHVLCAGRTIILTSHSMEEVDALASRLVIMAAGAATCLGTPQHLKSTFGDGYTLELRLSATAEASNCSRTAAQRSTGTTNNVQLQQEVQHNQSPVEAAAAATTAAEQHFLSLMPEAAVLEREPGRLLLRLPISSSDVNPTAIASAARGNQQQQQQQQGGLTSLADVFEAVESARQLLGITEYSLSQSSLERVFLALARVASQHVSRD